MGLEDLYLRDIARTDDGDLAVDHAGDLDTVTLTANLRQALLARLLTKPGTLVHRPEYGVGIQDFQNAPLTFERKRQLAVRLDAQFRQDPRVERVKEVRIDNMPDNPSGVIISVSVIAKGIGQAAFEFSIED